MKLQDDSCDKLIQMIMINLSRCLSWFALSQTPFELRVLSSCDWVKRLHMFAHVCTRLHMFAHVCRLHYAKWQDTVSEKI
jgi:hypothetical protein